MPFALVTILFVAALVIMLFAVFFVVKRWL